MPKDTSTCGPGGVRGDHQPRLTLRPPLKPRHVQVQHLSEERAEPRQPALLHVSTCKGFEPARLSAHSTRLIHAWTDIRLCCGFEDEKATAEPWQQIWTRVLQTTIASQVHRWRFWFHSRQPHKIKHLRTRATSKLQENVLRRPHERGGRGRSCQRAGPAAHAHASSAAVKQRALTSNRSPY